MVTQCDLVRVLYRTSLVRLKLGVHLSALRSGSALMRDAAVFACGDDVGEGCHHHWRIMPTAVPWIFEVFCDHLRALFLGTLPEALTEVTKAIDNAFERHQLLVCEHVREQSRSSGNLECLHKFGQSAACRLGALQDIADEDLRNVVRCRGDRLRDANHGQMCQRAREEPPG